MVRGRRRQGQVGVGVAGGRQGGGREGVWCGARQGRREGAAISRWCVVRMGWGVGNWATRSVCVLSQGRYNSVIGGRLQETP